MTEFTHLHLHTEYSLLDGLNRIEKLFDKIKKDGMNSCAITDHGVMYGIPEFFFLAKDFGIRPILGCEVYVSPKSRSLKQEVNGIKYYHLLLLAKDKTGFKNLNKIVSISQLEGYYYRPRVDREILAKYSQGIIAMSACLAGPISRHILRNEEAQARDWLEFLKNTYKGNFYLELQRNGFVKDDINSIKNLKKLIPEYQETIQQQIKVNTKLKEYAQEYKLPLVASCDAHYLNIEDMSTQEILFAIKDGNKLTDENRRLAYLDTYVKTKQEMEESFADLPEALENTQKIIEKIENFDITYDRVQPHYIGLEKGKTAQEELKEQVMVGAKKKYSKLSHDLIKRINYELDVIHQKGYDDYFLVVSDIMKWARNQGIIIGVRGSVAGSVVAYCLGIINVEPISWELYFERFLNPERPSPPDIDMDIQDDRRDEVIQYVEKKYGKEKVAAICAIGRMKTKAAIRDVARVMGIDLGIADKLSKMVHILFGKVKKIDKMMEDDHEFAEIINSDPQLIELKNAVAKIEGMARHISTHACGYLITPKPITDFVSIQKEAKGGERIITQHEGTWIEALGLMKFDFLGLRNLTILKNTLDFIKRYHGITIELEKIPLNDKKTFDLFTRGETMGIFQFEGVAMRKYLRQLKPESLEDICFMVSAYRPGPMAYISDYIKRKHKEQKTTYLVKEMEPILKNTYGFAIYQEQIIRIAVDIAGYTMGQADLLRRAMGKKKIKIMEEEEPKFKKGVMKKGYNKKIADQIWEYMLPFADYGFNKAHGAGYALIAYWCAYLKAHYPIEFIAGLMHSDIKDNDRIVVDIQEAQHLGFKILPPDINKSEIFFTIEGKNSIRFGLGAIKNTSDKAIERIVETRKKSGEFTSLDDLIERIGTKYVNKKTLECLIKVGAMDSWGSRNQLLVIMPTIWDRLSHEEKLSGHGQVDIFSMLNNSQNKLKVLTRLPDIPAESNQQKVAWEKDLIGIYVTEHPLMQYKKLLLTRTTISIKEAMALPENYDVNILASILEIRQIRTKNGNKPMAFIQIEDLHDKAEGVLFTKIYQKQKNRLEEFVPVVIKGKTSYREERFTILIDDIIPADNISLNDKITIDISDEMNKDNLKKLKNLIENNPGNFSLEIIYGNKFFKKKIIKKINPTEEFISIISKYNLQK